MNRADHLAALQSQATKVWRATYDRALGWSTDPDGDADATVKGFLARHGAS